MAGDSHGIRAHDFPFVHTGAIEVTSRCNLRCTYCMVSQPGYQGRDMAAPMLEGVLAELRRRWVDQLCLNGHGETTMRKGWEAPFRPLLHEFRMSIISNLARALTAEEADFLGQIDSVNVSLDSVNAELLREIRRPVELAVVVENLARIRSAATRSRRGGPRLVLYAGVYDRSVMQVEELAEWAVSMGFVQVVFWSLVKHPDVLGAVNVNTLATLHEEGKQRAIVSVESAVGILESNGVAYEFVGDFFEVFKRQVRAEGKSGRFSPVANRIFVTAEPGWTRNCFDPWYYSQVKATGDVYPCCAHGPIGRIGPDTRYAEVLDGPELRRLRQGLLTGELDPECRHCHMRATVPVGEFQARYRSTFGVTWDDRGSIPRPPWRSGEAGARSPGRGRQHPVLRALKSMARRLLAREFNGGVVAYLDAPAAGRVHGRTVPVRGWCFAPQGVTVTGQVLIDGVPCGEVRPDRARPDVRRAFPGAGVPLMCGFQATVRLPESIGPGQRFRLAVELVADGTRGRRLGPIALQLAATEVRPT